MGNDPPSRLRDSRLRAARPLCLQADISPVSRGNYPLPKGDRCRNVSLLQMKEKSQIFTKTTQ